MSHCRRRRRDRRSLTAPVGCHYLARFPWDLWPKAYPDLEILLLERLEDPEIYPFQGRVFEHDGGRSNTFPVCCCLCEDVMDYHVSCGVCRACTQRAWRKRNQFSEAAVIIIGFLEPVPAEACEECHPDWLGWYCCFCEYTIRGFPVESVSAAGDVSSADESSMSDPS